MTPRDRTSGKRFLQLRVVDLVAIGIDPNQALNFYRRVVVGAKPFPPPDPTTGAPATPRPLEVATIPAKAGPYQVTSLLHASKYRGLNLFDEDQAEKLLRFDRHRSVPGGSPRGRGGDETRSRPPARRPGDD